jgi:hypothetical protein
MAEVDPDGAARALAEADRQLRRGAELVLPRGRWLYSAIFLMGPVWGGTRDVPQHWRAAPMLALGLGMFGCIGLLRVRRRARPLPVRHGWRYQLLIWMAVVGSVALSVGVGLALRAAGVWLPFTLSGLLLSIEVVLLMRVARRWGYVEQVAKAQW